ncbi:glucose-6-phosphate isomerase, partial [Marinomonas sp. 42_23_T18]
MGSPVHLPAWQALSRHHDTLTSLNMSDLFKENPARAKELSATGAGWTLDFSKNRATQETLSLLIQLAKDSGLKEATDALFNGDEINNTENRSVLHTALRASHKQESLIVNGSNVLDEVRATLAQMKQFIAQLTSKKWRGYNDKAITDVVSIGIGGSYLGPKVVTEALTPYANTGIKVHFVANIDGSDISGKLSKLNPETTLFLISSKSFGTLETLYNANAARA